MTTPINGSTSNLELTAKNRRVAMPLFGETTAYDEVAKLAQLYEQKLTALAEEHRASILALKDELSSHQEATQQRFQELEKLLNYKNPSATTRLAAWSKDKWSGFKARCSSLWSRLFSRNQSLTPEQVETIAALVAQQLQQNQLSVDINPKEGDYKAIDDINEVIRNYQNLGNEDLAPHLPYLENEDKLRNTTQKEVEDLIRRTHEMNQDQPSK